MTDKDKKRRKFRGVIGYALCVLMLISGCGVDNVPTGADAEAVTGIDTVDEVELVDPVTVELSYETVRRRNLYDADVYPAVVCPTIQQYGLENSITFESYDTFLGSSVRRGDLLLHGDATAMDESIAKLEKSILEMEESYQEFLTEKKEALKEPKEQEELYSKILENLDDQVPARYITVTVTSGDTTSGNDSSGSTSGNDVSGNGIRETTVTKVNTQYTQWESERQKYEGLYTNALQTVYELGDDIRQREELYELDHTYQLKQLEYLKADRQQLSLVSGMNGTVAAVRLMTRGDRIAAGQNLAAVANTEDKVLRCEYLASDKVTSAQEIYAVIDGEKYRVSYEEMDSAEYLRQKKQNGTVYSTFRFEEGDLSAVGMGSYAVIVVVRDKAENVLTVSSEVLNKDGSNSYVYVLDGEKREYVPVKTGRKKGLFTEILSGLEEGQKVLRAEKLEAGTKEQEIVKGEVGNSFSGSGTLFYPTSEWVTCTVQYGTVYFVESLVKEYQRVERGDVIARVWVEADSLVLQQNQKKLLREQERLADLKAAGTEGNEKAIAAREESIQELAVLIDEMQADYAVTEIRTDAPGIVIDLADHKKDDVLKTGDKLCLIADESKKYIQVADDKEQLAYGSEVSVTYTDQAGEKQSVTGVVANLNSMALGSSMTDKTALIRLPGDAEGGIPGSRQANNGQWKRSLFEVKTQTACMRNVLVVPKGAVRTYGGCTYVKVRLEDGEIIYQSFLAGGSDYINYWVAEGLTEGMKICLE